jgi:glucosamine-6-phosphate deaminase
MATNVTARMRRFDSAEDVGSAVAADIVQGIRTARKTGERYVLGCPSGRTPRATYRALARLAAEHELEVDHVVIAMIDEYVERDPRTGRLLRIPDHRPHSCVRFGREEIIGPLNAASGGSAIRDDALWAPFPEDPAAYDDALAAAGGIDFMILAVGASDGHVGFNPPGSPADSGSRVVELAAGTRRDTMASFPTLTSLDDVPTHGVTMGIRTLRELSTRAVLVATGEAKRSAAARLASALDYDPDWPATVVHTCADGEIWVDRAASTP